MCDYSLMGVPNRLAREGDDLVVYEFPTGSKGFTSAFPASAGKGGRLSTLRSFLKGLISEFPAEKTAVCIPPGARLLLRDIPKAVQVSSGVGSEEEVHFTQISAEAYDYRDAVRFRNGLEVLLQQLTAGQRAKVLQLSLDHEQEPVASIPEEREFLRTRIDFIAPRLLR